MKITSFNKYYKIEKFRKTFVQTEMQMGKRSVKKNGSRFKGDEGRGIIYLQTCFIVWNNLNGIRTFQTRINSTR
jgi:hypothetical protein